MVSPSALAVTRPLLFSVATLGSFSEKRLAPVTSRSNPSEYFPSATKRWLPAAPHSVAFGGKRRREMSVGFFSTVVFGRAGRTTEKSRAKATAETQRRGE